MNFPANSAQTLQLCLKRKLLDYGSMKISRRSSGIEKSGFRCQTDQSHLSDNSTPGKDSPIDSIEFLGSYILYNTTNVAT